MIDLNGFMAFTMFCLLLLLVMVTLGVYCLYDIRALKSGCDDGKKRFLIHWLIALVASAAVILLAIYKPLG